MDSCDERVSRIDEYMKSAGKKTRAPKPKAPVAKRQPELGVESMGGLNAMTGESKGQIGDIPESPTAKRKGARRKRRIVRDQHQPTPTIEEWKRRERIKKSTPSLIEHLLPDQPGKFIVVTGRTGIGKTNLLLYMAYCLATGEPFYGFKCEQTTIAYYAFEGVGKNYSDRIKKIEKLFPPIVDKRLFFDLVQVQRASEMYMNLIEKLRELKERGCRVVIIDSTRYIVPGDYLKPADVTSFVQLLKEQLTGLGMIAVLALPIRKPPEGRSLFDPDDVYRIKGATEYVDTATSVLLLEKRPRAPIDNVTLYIAKHRIAEKEMESIDLDFNRDKCVFDMTDNRTSSRIKMTI